MLCCGIPAVVLEGADEDWVKLNETYEYFKSVFGESELKDWFRQFDKIMELFMMMRKFSQTNSQTKSELGMFDKIINLFKNNNTDTNNTEMDNTAYIKEMWKRVISYIPQGSGGDKILGGWVRLFVPYNGSNKLIKGLDGDLPMFDLTKSEPSRNIDCYTWQDKMKQFYLGGGWGEMFSSHITTPANLIDYDGTEHNVEFYSGFFEPYLSNSDEIKMNIGYIIREDQQIKKDTLKRHYQNKGVECRDKFSLNIPKHLQKKTTEILDVFGAHAYSYFGTDPEEERRKQYFIDNGVKKEKTKYSYKCVVPSKFKDDEIIIEEIKKLFSVYKIEYYD
jgi:hypothetical protein